MDSMLKFLTVYGDDTLSPGLLFSAFSVPENSAQGTAIATLTTTNASNPGAVSIASQEVANLFQMNVDGVTLEVGSGATELNYEVRTSATVTLQYTDDAGVHQFIRSISITDVADGPTLTGAASTFATLFGTPNVGTPLSFDLRNGWVSPTGQTMTFTVQPYGSIAGDGFTFNWTPNQQEHSDTSGAPAFTITATDEDGQEATTTEYLTLTTSNTAPTIVPQDLEFLVPEGAAPAIASASPADDATGVAVATDPTVSFDRDILFGTGNIYLYNVTGAAILETFVLPGDIGTGPGTVSISGNTLTIEPTSDLPGGTEIARLWDAGALTNLGGIGVAALSDTTTLSFTTASAAPPPTLSSAVPADEATDVLIEAPTVLTFNEGVSINGTSGEFYRYQGATLIETFDVDAGTGDLGGTIVVSGSTVTITDGAIKDFNLSYNTQWNAGAVKSTATNAPIAANATQTLHNFTTEAAPAARTLSSSYMHTTIGTPTVLTGKSDNYYLGFYAQFNLSNTGAYKGFFGSQESGADKLQLSMKGNEGVEFSWRDTAAANVLAIVDNRNWVGAHEMWVTIDSNAGNIRYYIDGADESAGATLVNRTATLMDLTNTRLVVGALGGLSAPFAGTITKMGVWFPDNGTLFADLDPTTTGGRSDMADPRQFRTLAGGASVALFGSAATWNAQKNRGLAGDFATKVGTFS